MMPGWLLERAALTAFPARIVLKLVNVRASFGIDSASKHGKLPEVIAAGLALPEDSDAVRAISRDHLRFLARYRIWRVMQKPAHFQSVRLEIEGETYLKEALSEGKGVLLATMHFGLDKCLAPVLKTRGYTVHTLGSTRLSRRERLSKAGEFVRFKLLRLPSFYRADAVDIPAGLNARPLVNALARNEAVIVVMDGKQSTQHARVESFAGSVRIATGALSVARSTGAPILPAFSVDDPTDPARVRVFIRPPLELVSASGAAFDDDTIVSRYAEVFTQVALANPQCVHWKRMRWLIRDQREAKKRRKEQAASA